MTADGPIVLAKHNNPGSWNYGDMNLAFHESLVDPQLYPGRRYGVVADSAFPCSGGMTGRILTSLMDGDLAKLLPSVRPVAKRLSHTITFVRQAAEWDMGSVEKVYYRVLLPLPSKKKERSNQLDNFFRLSNYRVRTVGISHIRTTHMHGLQDNR